MKKIFLPLLLGALLLTPIAFASIDQARQDYLFQFDTYRQKYSEFEIAKNEYKKFGTLTAQTTALEKTKIMLSQRDQLLHSYLMLLVEKLNEDQGLGTTTKQQYLTIIQNELTFLEKHTQLIQAIASLEDAENISGELESHYKVLQISIRQILTVLAIGQLNILGNKYDNALKEAQAIMATYAGIFSPEKQQTINRWILQITNKRSLYQQKLDAIASLNVQLDTPDLAELDRQYNQISLMISEARQYLVEGASFLIELKNALKYYN